MYLQTFWVKSKNTQQKGWPLSVQHTKFQLSTSRNAWVRWYLQISRKHLTKDLCIFIRTQNIIFNWFIQTLFCSAVIWLSLGCDNFSFSLADAGQLVYQAKNRVTRLTLAFGCKITTLLLGLGLNVVIERWWTTTTNLADQLTTTWSKSTDSMADSKYSYVRANKQIVTVRDP